MYNLRENLNVKYGIIFVIRDYSYLTFAVLFVDEACAFPLSDRYFVPLIDPVTRMHEGLVAAYIAWKIEKTWPVK